MVNARHEAAKDQTPWSRQPPANLRIEKLQQFPFVFRNTHNPAVNKKEAKLCDQLDIYGGEQLSFAVY